MKKIFLLSCLLFFCFLLVGCNETTSEEEIVTEDEVIFTEENLAGFFGKNINDILDVIPELVQNNFDNTIYSNEEISVKVDDQQRIISIVLEGVSPYDIDGLTSGMSVEEAKGIMESICSNIQEVDEGHKLTIGDWNDNPKVTISYYEAQDVPDTIYDIVMELKPGETLDS